MVKYHLSPIEIIIERVLFNSIEVSLGVIFSLLNMTDHGEKHFQFNFIIFLYIWIVPALNHEQGVYVLKNIQGALKVGILKHDFRQLINDNFYLLALLW